MREWLCEYRQKKNLSQLEVSEKCGITRQYYGFIENGERGDKLPVATAKKIAEVLEFDWTEFYKED